MRSAETLRHLTAPDGGIVQACITGWEDGSILITVGDRPAQMDVAEAKALLGWAALDGVPCVIVSEIPARELADRAALEPERAARRAAAEAERVARETEPPEPAPVAACVKCGATGVELVPLPTGGTCLPCVIATFGPA